MKMYPTVLDTIVRLLAAQPAVERVVLSGSRARGDADPRSDIDLAVDAPGATGRQWLDWEARIDNVESLLRVDVVRWDEASPALRARIAHEGQGLYDRCRERPHAPRQLEQPHERVAAPA